MLTTSERALARAVLIHGPISRSALTTRLGLSPASLTRLAKPFLDRGLLIELDDSADGTVGRPVRPLDVAPQIGRFAGVKITGETVHAIVTGVRAEVLAEDSQPLIDTDPEQVARQVARMVRALAPTGLSGTGVGLGGAVRDGVVEYAPFLGWRDVPFGALLEREVGGPVSLENDLIALAEAERWFGLGRGKDGFVVITIGAGVGYALVIGGEVVRTPDAGIGMGGHIPLSPAGPLCVEGHRGCSQAMLTAGSMAAQVSGALQRPVAYDEVLSLAREGAPAAVAVVDSAAAALGRLIVLAANLTLQSSIVLAGEGLGLFAIAEDRIREVISAERDPRAEAVRLYVDESGFLAWARGAAAVAIQAAMDRIRLT
ncbi:ROK family transcriptional regulator [Microbacterium yannicii]|uniref:ROK family transcriptional regulator n=1 Tax=Microbacterium yannicii TaxID=671622 RepID=UPI0003039D94|nr:ROK family transcriptional regulator [Microbacterium yannicii]